MSTKYVDNVAKEKRGIATVGSGGAMIDVVTIAGSPATPSRCAAALETARELLERRGLTTAGLNLRDLPAEALLGAGYQDPSVRRATALVTQARAIIVATPVYKAAYSGLLKTFLDLLPADAMAGKGVLPIATAGSLAHCLVLEYALKPVLSALGAASFLPGVCLIDSDFIYGGDGLARLETAAGGRLAAALDALEDDVRGRRDRANELLEIAV
jgi:FMN reductase